MARRKPKPPYALVLALILGFVQPGSADAATKAVECWTGWGYRVDPRSRTYTSPELLLTTKGPAAWQPGQGITLYLVDRASGRIDTQLPPIVVIPFNPRSSYRNNLNYIDGEGQIAGREENLVFGLSHVPKPAADIEEMRQYNLWACGLEGSTD